MAPMSLKTYAETRPWVRSIKTRVAGRQMPPWQIDRTVGMHSVWKTWVVKVAWLYVSPVKGANEHIKALDPGAETNPRASRCGA